MALIQQVRFSIFSGKERQELQNEVMDLEDLAERRDIAVQKINKSKLEKRGGIFAPNELDEVLPSVITKRSSAALNSRISDSKQANAFRNNDTTSAAPFERANAFKKIQRDLTFLKEGQRKTQEVLRFVNDPSGTVFTKLLGQANKILPVGLALSIATTVFGLIEAQFGSGGIFDIRKRQLNAVKSLYGLERQTDIIGGETLFLGDPTLIQGIPKNTSSNTVNLRDGQRRFVLRSNGF